MTKGCKVCGKDFRSGRRCHVVGDDGKLVRAIICTRCADGAVMIVPRPAVVCGCGATPAKCTACVAKAVAQAKTEGAELDRLVRRLKGMIAAKTYDAARCRPPAAASNGDELVDAQIEGLESAIALIESGRW